MFGHTLTINFMLGISVVFISMHQFFSPLSKAKEDQQNGMHEKLDIQDNHRSRESSFINMAAGANEEASHRVPDERQPLLPT
ncbi:CMP-sialic acid transporter 2-like [Primulina huaijiensis]